MSDVSLILIPRNLQETVDRFLPELCATVKTWKRSAEVICLEDGGCPAAPKAMAALQAAWPSIRMLSIDPALGLSVALSAGIDAANGERLCVIEATGRYPAREITRLLDRLSRADVVFGCRRAGRLSRSFRLLARVPRRLVLGIDVRDPACLFWAARHEAVAGLQLTPGTYPLVPRLVAQRGFRVGELHVEHRPEVPPLDGDLGWLPVWTLGPKPIYAVREHFIPQDRRAAA